MAPNENDQRHGIIEENVEVPASANVRTSTLNLIGESDRKITDQLKFDEHQRFLITHELEEYLIREPLFAIRSWWNINSTVPVTKERLLAFVVDEEACVTDNNTRSRLVEKVIAVDNQLNVPISAGAISAEKISEFQKKGGGETFKDVFNMYSVNRIFVALLLSEQLTGSQRMTYTGRMYRMAREIMGERLLFMARQSTTFFNEETADKKIFLRQRARGERETVVRPTPASEFFKKFFDSLNLEPNDKSLFGDALDEFAFNVFKLSAIVAQKKIMGKDKSKELSPEALVNDNEVLASFKLIRIVKLAYEQVPQHAIIGFGNDAPKNDFHSTLVQMGYQFNNLKTEKGFFSMREKDGIRTVTVWPQSLEYPVMFSYEGPDLNRDPATISIRAIDPDSREAIFTRDDQVLLAKLANPNLRSEDVRQILEDFEKNHRNQHIAKLLTGKNRYVWMGLATRNPQDRQFVLYPSDYDPENMTFNPEKMAEAIKFIAEFNTLVSSVKFADLQNALLYKYLGQRCFNEWHKITGGREPNIKTIHQILDRFQKNPFLETRQVPYESSDKRYSGQLFKKGQPSNADPTRSTSHA